MTQKEGAIRQSAINPAKIVRILTGCSQRIADRPVIQSLSIQDARIILKGLIHGPNESQVAPTLVITQTYRFTQGTLWLSRQVISNEDGTEARIDITSPAFGSEVGQNVELKGNMPATPFENTLGYIISDSSGSQLNKDSFMVESAEVGTPATFDQIFDLSAIPSGTVIRISLFEGDMSGSKTYRVMDAVELTVTSLENPPSPSDSPHLNISRTNLCRARVRYKSQSKAGQWHCTVKSGVPCADG